MDSMGSSFSLDDSVLSELSSVVSFDRTYNQNVCYLGAKYATDVVMISNKLEKEDLIVMMVEYYKMVDKSRGMVKMEEPPDTVRNRLNNMNTTIMLNKVMTGVFIVGKSMENTDKDNRISTNIQDIVERYSENC